eukprot:6193584-Pleurochrysis_carterae.AAC.8
MESSACANCSFELTAVASTPKTRASCARTPCRRRSRPLLACRCRAAIVQPACVERAAARAQEPTCQAQHIGAKCVSPNCSFRRGIACKS